MIPLPPRSTLFPYTTLFRSGIALCALRHLRSRAGFFGLARPGLQLRLLVPQRNNRMDSRRPPRRQVTRRQRHAQQLDRKSTRLNSSHVEISYAVFSLKKSKKHATANFSFLHSARNYFAILA